MKKIKKCKMLMAAVLFFALMLNTISVVAAEPDANDLDPAKEEALRNDYVTFLDYPNLTPEDVEYEYYGTYHDCEVVLMSVKDQNDTADIREIRIGRYIFTFYMGSASTRFYLHKDHTFMPVLTAYEEGYLNDADIAQVADNFEGAEELKMPYKDVSEKDWFYSYVDEMFIKGIMTGIDFVRFGPNEILSRAEFATILYRMEGSPEVGFKEVFKDVEKGQFYSSAVIWASSEDVGIIKGYTDGRFGPNDKITREQMAVMLYRYADYKGIDLSAEDDLKGFPDSGLVSEFAEKDMRWAVGAGIISGNADMTLAPQASTSRAVCATMITRVLDLF